MYGGIIQDWDRVGNRTIYLETPARIQMRGINGLNMQQEKKQVY